MYSICNVALLNRTPHFLIYWAGLVRCTLHIFSAVKTNKNFIHTWPALIQLGDVENGLWTFFADLGNKSQIAPLMSFWWDSSLYLGLCDDNGAVSIATE